MSSPKITPIAKELMREHNLSYSDITGTGKDGRITVKDVERAAHKKTKKSPSQTRKSPSKTRKSPPKTRKSPPKTRKSPLQKTSSESTILEITLKPYVDNTSNYTNEDMEEFKKWFHKMLPQLTERGCPVNTNNIEVEVLSKTSIKINLEITDGGDDEAEFIAGEIKGNLDDGNNPIGVNKRNKNIEFIENPKTYSGNSSLYLVRFKDFKYSIK